MQVQINDVPAGTEESGYRAEDSYVKLKGLADKLVDGFKNNKLDNPLKVTGVSYKVIVAREAG